VFCVLFNNHMPKTKCATGQLSWTTRCSIYRQSARSTNNSSVTRSVGSFVATSRSAHQSHERIIRYPMRRISQATVLQPSFGGVWSRRVRASLSYLTPQRGHEYCSTLGFFLFFCLCRRAEAQPCTEATRGLPVHTWLACFPPAPPLIYVALCTCNAPRKYNIN
jgi:hypothetical protein